jgi:hypothetical protein
MKCIELANIYNLKTKNKDNISDDDRIKIIRDLIHPKKYLSFQKKQDLVLDILNKVVDISDDGQLLYNSCEKYVLFITTLLSIYTDLDIDEKSYDVLCSNYILNYTMASLGSEYDICLGIMEMYIDDLEHNRIKLRKS